MHFLRWQGLGRQRPHGGGGGRAGGASGSCVVF